MKIVNRETFLSLPKGTIYSLYKPMVADGLFKKVETLENDWIYIDLLDTVDAVSSEERFDILIDAEQTGRSFNTDYNITSRDGGFEEIQLFMVLEKADVFGLIKALQG